MATSGSKSTHIAEGILLTFSWEVSAQSSAYNQSFISWEISVKNYGNANNLIADKAEPYYILVDGENRINGQILFNCKVGEEKGVAYGNFSVDHELTGEKTFNYEVHITVPDFGGITEWNKGDVVISDSVELEKIDITPKVFCPNGTIGGSVEISIQSCVGVAEQLPSQTSLYKCDLFYVIGDLSFAIAEKISLFRSVNCPWSIPKSIYEYLPVDSSKLTCVIQCKAYTTDGGDFVGESSCEIELSANADDCKPIISAFGVQDVKNETVLLTGNNKRLIKGNSNACAYMSVGTQYRATIVEKYIKCGDIIITDLELNDNGYFEYVFEKVKSRNFTFIVRDSRGFANKQTVTPAFVDYIDLTGNLSVAKPSAGGVAKFAISGNYFNGAFDFDGVNRNALTVSYRCIGFSEDWVAITPYINGNEYSTIAMISGLDYTKQYTFEVKVSDRLNEIVKRDTVKAIPAFDWGENDFNFNVPVYVNGLNLSGAAKALTTRYDLPFTRTFGNDYSAGICSVTLVGNNLCCVVRGTRWNSSVGDIPDEDFLTLTIEHGGKIKSAESMYLAGGRNGISSFSITLESIDDTHLTVKITVNAVAIDESQLTACFSMPCTLNLDAY